MTAVQFFGFKIVTPILTYRGIELVGTHASLMATANVIVKLVFSKVCLYNVNTSYRYQN